MAYDAMVKKNIAKAFQAIGDLAVNVTFTTKTNSGFDFAANSVASPTTTSVIVKGIFDKKSRRPGAQEVGQSQTMRMIFIASDMPDPTGYDSVQMPDGLIWKVVQPYENDGYLTTVNFAREA
jgi:ribosomal protein L11